MALSDDCLHNAVECERDAGKCGPGSSRDALLEIAAMWRRLAEAAKRDETIQHLLDGAGKTPKKDGR